MKAKHVWVLGVMAAVLAGCADKPDVRYVDPGAKGSVAGTGIESQDLLSVTDQMARSIINTKQISNAGRPPQIVILPVENTTRFPIDSDIFTKRIQALLSQKLGDRVIFVARDRIAAVQKERELQASGQVTSPGKRGELSGADYFLTGELSGISMSGRKGQSDYVLYTFRLIDAQTSNQLWQDFAEIKKEGIDSAVYR